MSRLRFNGLGHAMKSSKVLTAQLSRRQNVCVQQMLGRYSLLDALCPDSAASGLTLRQILGTGGRIRVVRTLAKFWLKPQNIIVETYER